MGATGHGARLAWLLAHRQITQAELARRIDRRPAQIGELLGEGRWQLPTVGRVAEALEVSPTFFLGDLEPDDFFARENG